MFHRTCPIHNSYRTLTKYGFTEMKKKEQHAYVLIFENKKVKKGKQKRGQAKKNK